MMHNWIMLLTCFFVDWLDPIHFLVSYIVVVISVKQKVVLH